jgi:predicted metal-dependent hydrolase
MATAAPEPAASRVEVRRSRRRRRTVSAYREDDRVVVMIPARLSVAEEREWVATMLERLERSERRRRPSDAGLRRRASELSDRYLGGLARPATVRWVDNQNSRWGSCTPGDRSIRLSRRLQGVPAWVIDYVLVHELAHLLEPGHTAAFWEWVDRYPKAERAKGFLEGMAAASQLGITADPPDCSAADGCAPAAPAPATPARAGSAPGSAARRPATTGGRATPR